jgi:hypothetical protein
VEAALAALSGVVITIIACGDSSPTSPAPPPANPGDASGVVGSNHGHAAVVTSAQLMSPSNLRLDIRGNADHAHTVDLTAGEVEQIGRGVRVSKLSSTEDAHAHSVTFN